ncbi:MAG TPA: hypothetical protein VJN65_08160 [Bacteroidota bacterium]|nr:hypothetical protein [Bacteroidota bacterium]
MSAMKLFLCLIVVATSSTMGQFREKPQPLEANMLRLQEPATGAKSEKSVLLGVVLSLVVPGTGEWYADNLSTGQYFMGADGILWLSYAGISLRGTWIRNDARLFASLHSGAVVDGKEEQFEVDIGNFESTDEYNQAKLRNREFDLLYEQPEFLWSWDMQKNRQEYRSLRIRSDEYFQNAKFVVGALVINRLISAFSAWRSVNRYNKSLGAGGSWDMKAEIQGGLLDNQGLAVRLTRTF